MMSGEEMQMDPSLEDPADLSDHNIAENSEHVEEDHLGYNPQLNGTYDPQLRDDRRENKNKLRRRFEHIFEKYERDFEGIGDEIDLSTGEIVVNNGHVQNMRNEHDTGDKVTDEAVVSSFEHSDVNESEEEFGDDEDGESDEGSVVGEVGNGNFSALDVGAESATSILEPDESGQESDLGNNSSHVIRKTGVNTIAELRDSHQAREQSVGAVSSISGASSENGGPQDFPDNLLEQVPGLKESMLTAQSNYKHGKTIDPVAIHALGISIANQLAAFISRRGEQKQKRRSKRSISPASSYPALPEEQVTKRQRSPSPQPQVTEPASTGKKSIWAPVGHPRQQKKRRVKEREVTQLPEQTENDALSFSEDNTSVHPSPRQIRDGRLKSCTNCGTSDSHIWRKGPNGVLCNTCGMYVYRYGLMRPVGPALEGDVPMTRGDDPITPEATEGEGDPLEKDWWLGLDSNRSEKRKDRVKPVGVRNSHFVLEEDALIIKLKEIDLLSWERMATYFPGRSAYALQCRYSKRLHSCAPEARNMLLEQGYRGTPNDKGVVVFSYTRDVFKEDEDELLLKLRDDDGLEWEAVAASLPGRTAEVLEQRYNELARQYLGAHSDYYKSKGGHKPATKESSYPTTKSLRYSAEEDTLIVKLREVDKLNWEKVAENIAGRNSFSLQKRYIRELCGRHPDSICPPRKAYERATPSFETMRVEGDDSDVAPDFHDSLMVVDSPTTATHEGVSSFGSGSLLVTQDDPAANESLNVGLEFGTSEFQDDTNTNSGMTTNQFTDVEDRLIIKLRDLENLPWPEIAAHLPDRDISSISERYYHHLDPQRPKAVKSAAKRVVRQQPPSPALSTASASKNRDAPKRWTDEETNLAESLRKQGKSWSEIASYLPGRTAGAVRGRYGAMFDPNKKAYQQRVSRNSTGNSKSQAPLLRQAVSNLRRRSMSALSFEDEEGPTVSFADELSVRSTQPVVQPSISKRFSTEESIIGQTLNQELQNSHNDTNQRLHPVADRGQTLSGMVISNAAGMHAPRSVQATTHTDGRLHIYPDTPARSEFLHSSSTEVTPVAAGLYATPARYNQQGHPYFLPIPPSYPLPKEVTQDEHNDEVEKRPVAKSARALPALKAKNTKRTSKGASQDKAKAQRRKADGRASRKSKAARKSPLEYSSDGEDAITYNPSDSDSTASDEASDDASDSDFIDAASSRRTVHKPDSAIDRADKYASKRRFFGGERPSSIDNAGQQVLGTVKDSNINDKANTRTNGEVGRGDPESASTPETDLGEKKMDEDSAHELEKPATSSRSDAMALHEDVDDEQVETSLPSIDNPANGDDETSKVERPSLTYNQLVTMALESKAPEPLLLSDIYKFLEIRFQYFRETSIAWKQSIRGALGRGHQFKRVSSDSESGWILLEAPAIETASVAEALTDDGQEAELDRSMVIDTTDVKAHSEETFLRRGKGRWSKGSPSRSSSAKETVSEPRTDGKGESVKVRNDPEVKVAPEPKSRSRKTKSLGDDKTPLPAAPARPRGRPRIHPIREGPKRPRGRPPKHAKQAVEPSSSVLEGPDEIPNSDAGDLESSEDILMHTAQSQDFVSLEEGLPKLDDGAKKPILQPSQPTTMASEPSADFVRPPDDPSSDIIREPSSEPVTCDTGDQQAIGETSLIEDSSELSIKTNDALAASSPVMTNKTSSVKKGDKTSTPGTDSSTLFSHTGQQRVMTRMSPAKATPSALPRIRSIIEPYSRKRVLFTPVRDFDDSEDELAL